MKGKKDILRRVCEGGNVVTREIDEVSDGGNTMQDERGRDGVSIRQNQNITEDMLEGFTLVCPGENHDESWRQKPKKITANRNPKEWTTERWIEQSEAQWM